MSLIAWEGWITFDSTEIINVARCETYAKNAGLEWFIPQYKNEALPQILGDGETYRTPLLDDAPCVDPDNQASLDFYGVYPLNVTGIEDSTRESTVIQSLSNGGTPGRIRHATKTVVFSTLLIAGTEAAADYGMRWLREALLGGVCGPGPQSSCNGAEMCYLSSAPDLETIGEEIGTMALLDGGGFTVLADFNVIDGRFPGSSPDQFYDGGGPADSFESVIDGGTPQGNTVVDTSVSDPVLDGGRVSDVIDLIFDGGSPRVTGGFIRGAEFPFLVPDPVGGVDPGECMATYQRSLRRVLFNDGPTVTAKKITSDGGAIWTVQFSATAAPWEWSSEVKVLEGFLDPAVPVPWVGGITPLGGALDTNGYIHPEAACAETVYAPLHDPLAPSLIPPPGPPSVPLGYFVPPTNWRRRQFTIPPQFVPTWGEVVPKVNFHARVEMRNLRLRFYADRDGNGDITNDPCAYCGDILVSYIPAGYTLTLDGSEETVYVIGPGGVRRRADAVVFKTNGTPFDWPALTCGFGYIVTVDAPQTQEPPVIDLSLYARAG